jgi:FKBP-type peptidyl-prolyl cis-trans isomerase
MATKTHHRVFALVMALLFLGTALASGAAVIWQINQDNKQTKAQKDLQSQLSGQNASQQTQDTQNNQPQEGKLEGTKLANFTPVAKVDSLQIVDLKEGTGDPVKAGATVTAHYTGALANNGTIFQSSKDTGQPFTAPLSNLIKGWQDGIPGMKPGGVRRLLIPAAQAYGSQEQPGIPANSDLVFDIELISVQ